MVTSWQIKKLYKVPDFPSKRLPNWRTRGLEQRRQGLYPGLCGAHSIAPQSTGPEGGPKHRSVGTWGEGDPYLLADTLSLNFLKGNGLLLMAQW